MKVLIVYANIPMEPLLPLGVSILATTLENEGDEVEIFDTTLYPGRGDDQKSRLSSGQIQETNFSEVGLYPKQNNIFDDFKAHVNEFSPDLIGVSCVEPTYEMSLKLINCIKDFKIPVIYGGVFASFSPELILDSGLVDMVCIGDGESAIIEVTKAIQKNKEIENIPNLWIKKGNDKVPPVSYRLTDVESIAIPRFHLFEPKRIYRPMSGKLYKMVPVEISRGCPYKCSYCSAPSYHKKFSSSGKWLRFKDVSQIIAEIDFYQKEYNAEYFYLVSETFLAMPKQSREEFYKLYDKYSIPFWFNTRPETIREEDVKQLEQIGCHRISVGIESGNEVFRAERLNRKYTNKTAIERIQTIINSKIEISVNNMIGFPDETRELIFDTIKVNKEFTADSHTVSVFQPFRGTSLYDYCVEKGYYDKNKLSGESFSSSSLTMPNLSKEEINGLYRTFNLYRLLDKSYWPDIKQAESFDENGNKVFEELRKIAYNN